MTNPETTPTRGRPALSADAHAKRQDEIAEIALRLFLEEGYGAVSMRRLGKEVGLSPMALYRYYPSKLDILARLWGHILRQAFDQVSAVTPNDDSPSVTLRRAATAYVTYWLNHRDHYHLVFMNGGVGPDDVRSFVGHAETVAQYDVFFELAARVLARDRHSPQVKVAADGLLCALHGIMHTLITMQGYAWTDSDTLIDHAVSDLVNRRQS